MNEEFRICETCKYCELRQVLACWDDIITTYYCTKYDNMVDSMDGCSNHEYFYNDSIQ